MKTVNNSEITTVINQTQNLSVVSTTISTSYEESLARVELVIRDNLDRIRRNSRTTRSSSTRRRIRRLTTPPTARPGRPRGFLR